MKRANIECFKEWIDKSILAVKPNRKQRQKFMINETKNNKKT